MRLLNLKPDEIQKLIADMSAEVREIYKSAAVFSWYMRGGMSFTDIMNMDHSQREMINNIVKDNLETTKKSGLNFF